MAINVFSEVNKMEVLGSCSLFLERGALEMPVHEFRMNMLEIKKIS